MLAISYLDMYAPRVTRVKNKQRGGHEISIIFKSYWNLKRQRKSKTHLVEFSTIETDNLEDYNFDAERYIAYDYIESMREVEYARVELYKIISETGLIQTVKLLPTYAYDITCSKLKKLK